MAAALIFFAFGQDDAHGMLLSLSDESEFKEPRRDVRFTRIEDAGEIGHAAADRKGEVGVDGLFVFGGHAGEVHTEYFNALFLHLALEGGDFGHDFSRGASGTGEGKQNGRAEIGGRAGVQGDFKRGVPAAEIAAVADHEVGIRGDFGVFGEDGVDKFAAFAGVDVFTGGAEAGEGAEQRGLAAALCKFHHAGDGFILAGSGRKRSDEERASHRGSP